MARQVLEIDDITGDHIVRVPDEFITELGWDIGDDVEFYISKDSSGQDLLVVYLN